METNGTWRAQAKISRRTNLCKLRFIQKISIFVQLLRTLVLHHRARKMSDTAVGCNKIACAKCGTRSGRLKKCARCQFVRYCGSECQRADWKDHKKYCLLDLPDLPSRSCMLYMLDKTYVIEVFLLPILMVKNRTLAPVFVQGYTLQHYQEGVLNCFIDSEPYLDWPQRDYNCYYCKEQVKKMLERFPEAYRSWPDGERVLVLRWETAK